MSTWQAWKDGESESQFRQAMAYLFAKVSTGKAATGVVDGLAVTQSGGGAASVLVSPGLAVVQDATLSGVSPLVNNAQITLDVLGANPMGATPRNDIVVFDLSTEAVTLLVGTPAAVPSDPSVSSTQVPLARIRNAASATTVTTAYIDDLRDFGCRDVASAAPVDRAEQRHEHHVEQ